MSVNIVHDINSNEQSVVEAYASAKESKMSTKYGRAADASPFEMNRNSYVSGRRAGDS